MVQWGPDTVPADRHSGGYDYRDRHLSGFSLTHLSGAGCALYGDFPFLPTTEPIAPRRRRRGGGARRPLPAGLLPCRRARPPRLLLGPPQPGRRRRDRRRADRHDPHRHGPLHLPPLAARERPDRRRRQRQSRRPRRSPDRPRPARDLRLRLERLLLRPAAPLPGLLRRRLRPPLRRLRHLDAPDSWRRARPPPSTSQPPSTVPANTAQAGAYASFDTRHNRVVTVRVGVSFVSVAGARANLAAESRGASFGRIAAARRGDWNRALAPIRVGGGSRADARHLLHGALPRAARAPHLQRRRRPLHRHGRRRPRRRRPHPVRGLLRLGHLPHADPAAGDPDAAPGQRHRRLDARRRRAERLPAALVLRQRAEHDDGRRLRPTRSSPRPPPSAPAASTPAPRWRRWSRAPTKPAAAPTASYVERQGLGAVPGARLRALRPRRQAPQRQLALRRPRRGLGLGRDHARVRDRRLLDRPVRRPRPAATGRTYSSFMRAFRQLAQPPQPGTAARSSRASKMAPSPPTTTTSAAPASPRATPPSTPGWCPQDPAGLFARDRRPDRGREPPRPLPARRSTAAPAAPTPTTRCSATSPT